ncbi:GntR family transcriptional regulator [bacterium]|nr:GntR family transcriptional regulator [bacterium]
MKLLISNADPTPIYELIMKQIQSQIISGDLNAGEQLPSIRKLALELQISVITTKRAYDELENDGFINSVTGKGSFIAEQSQDLLKEKKMKRVEDKLSEAVDEARALGIPLTDMRVMLDLIHGDQ